MAGVSIDSGALSPTYRFSDVPKQRWPALVREKRNFLATNIKYDCRCLIEFCEEANSVWFDLGYASAADMIRNGYELDPQQIELAVAWLKINEPTAAIGMDAIKAKVAEARAKPLPDVGPLTEEEKSIGTIGTNRRGGNSTYTLRRLARDAPELLDKIEAGEMNVNQAAIAAGIRKKPSNAEKAVAAFKRSENRLEPLKLMVGLLEPYELAVLRDWCIERLD
jgi:hypothetical protein